MEENGQKPTPEQVEDAKRLARGSYGDQIGRFPFYYAQPILISKADIQTDDPMLTNGTITLLEISNRAIGVTCSHVIDGYREIAEADEVPVFQIGNVRINPIERLICESTERDLCHH